MTEVTVTVPDGVYEGDEFVLEYDGVQLTVVCPDGCFPGDAINLQVPAAGADDAQPSATIVVPDGCWPGDEFTVEFEGRTFNIGVPDGCGPGDELTVDVPEPEPEPEPEPRRGGSKHDQQKRPDFSRPLFDNSGSEKTRLETVTETSEDDHGYRFKPGQRVELLRSDGAYSPGTVVLGFEGVLDVMYKVQLDNGLFKEAVPEEDLSEELCEPGDLFDGF